MNPTEPTQGDQLRLIKPDEQPSIYHKLDGFACSFDHSSPVLHLIREAQDVIAIQFTNLMHDKQTLFEQEQIIDSLGLKIRELEQAKDMHDAVASAVLKQVSEPHPLLQFLTDENGDGRPFQGDAPCIPTVKFRFTENDQSVQEDLRKLSGIAEPETASDTSSSTSKPPLTLEDTYQGLLVCGFRGPSWSQDAEIVVKLLMTNTHAKYIALSHFGIRHISQVLARELPRICVHRWSSGNFVVNPFFDFSHDDRVNELGAEPQSDPGDEQPDEASTLTRNVEAHVKYVCDLAGVSYDSGTWKDWLQEVGRKFPIHLNSSDGGAKDGQDETV